jgi:hypothetical protein
MCHETEELDNFFAVDCPILGFKSWLEGEQRIRFPVPEKEFDYWVGRYFFTK